jgi:uncharacterized C2H2 Zn-finger protein
MADEKQFSCPECGMVFQDIIDEQDYPHRLENHGWVTGLPDSRYLACKAATPEEREAYKEAKRVVQKRNEEAIRGRAAHNRKIRAEGFEGKGKDQLGM